MNKVVAALAVAATCLPLAAAAAPLEAEDAVAYLLAGVQVSKTSVVAGTELVWKQKSAGKFVGIGENPDDQLRVNIDIRQIDGCRYEINGNIAVNGETVMTAAPATFDFSRIITMELIRPDLAGIDGTTDFCTSSDASVCSSVIDLAVVTDAATYSQVYTDFRRSNCP